MGWKYIYWTKSLGCSLSLLLYIPLTILMLLPPINTSNNACDWTGSGLSTQHKDREIVSIDLRCSAGKIVWNYPRGAIRILLRSNLRSPVNAPQGFRVCLKVHQTHSSSGHLMYNHVDKEDIEYQTLANNDLIPSNKIARIFLEAPKRLIPLYDDANDDKLVKCFRSINGQVALYVEADKTPFEIMQTIFEYNLEFINNKQHSIPAKLSSQTTLNNDKDDVIKDNAKDDTWWWWWTQWMSGASCGDDRKNSDAMLRNVNVRNKGANRNEDIIGGLGESWDICRPCSEEEMVHAYCSSDIVTRGTIFAVQQQPSLDTVEITVKRTQVLRNNMQAILNAEDTWRRHYKVTKFQTKKRRRKSIEDVDDDGDKQSKSDEFKFHTPTHCSPSHGEGEFVFIGRKRFDEVMLICAPRLEEWASISRRFNETDTAPCILLS